MSEGMQGLMELLKKALESGTITIDVKLDVRYVAVCPVCAWKRPYKSVGSRDKGLRAHIQRKHEKRR